MQPANAKPVSPDRLYIHRAPTSNDGTALVIRDSGFLGGGCRVTISLDGKKAAFIGEGEKAKFPVAPGRHMLTMEPSHKGLCALGAESARRSLTFSIKPSEVATFRVGLGGGPIFYQSSF